MGSPDQVCVIRLGVSQATPEDAKPTRQLYRLSPPNAMLNEGDGGRGRGATLVGPG